MTALHRAEPQACPQCSQSQNGLAHEDSCWFAFQLEIMVRRPMLMKMVPTRSDDALTVALDFNDDLHGIFDAWTGRIRALRSTDIKGRSHFVQVRLERALQFVDQQFAQRRASGELPKLTAVKPVRAA